MSVTITIYTKDADIANWYHDRLERRNPRDEGVDIYTPKESFISFETRLLDSKCIFVVTNEKNERVSFQLVSRSSIVKTPFMLHNGIGIIDKDFCHSLKIALRNVSLSIAESSQESLTQIIVPGFSISKITVINKEFRSEFDRGIGFGSTNSF